MKSRLRQEVCLGEHGGSALDENVEAGKLGGFLGYVGVENPTVGRGKIFIEQAHLAVGDIQPLDVRADACAHVGEVLNRRLDVAQRGGGAGGGV